MQWYMDAKIGFVIIDQLLKSKIVYFVERVSVYVEPNFIFI